MAIDWSPLPGAANAAVAIDLRLGIDQPTGHWPNAPRLKSYEAAGFSHVQVRMPPRHLLSDAEMVKVHAGALRKLLELTGLHLILHAPDDLLAGDAEHDVQLAGAIDYAAQAGCDLVVYHAARVPLTLGADAVTARLERERRSLAKLVKRAERLSVRLACENLAPVYPDRDFACHDPQVIAALVGELDSPAVGVCLDLGHAYIVSDIRGIGIVEFIEPVLDQVILFHAHDNFGADRPASGQGRLPRERAGGREPLRLDLHLAPGAGSLPWAKVAPLLAAQGAPLQLEVHPPARPEVATLAIVVRELLSAAHLSGV